MRPWVRYSPIVSGVALWLTFPPVSLFPLAWVGLIPYLDFLSERRKWPTLLGGHAVMTTLFLGGVLYWIPRVLVIYGGLHWAVAGLLFVLLLVLMSLFLLPFTLLTQAAARNGRFVALICAPGFWLLTELCRNYLLVNGFPWASLGYSQLPFLWIIQVADLGGIYCVSFLVVFVNCGVLIWFKLKEVRFGLGMLLIFLLANLYGCYRVHWWEPIGSYRIRAGLVQGNIELAGKREYYAKMYFEDLPRLAREAAAAGAKWILLPEAQNPFVFEQDFYFKTFWTGEATKLGAYILFNSAAIEPAARGIYYNSAYLLKPTGEVAYRYDKVHLVPFGEYLPFAEWLTFAQPLVAEVGGFHPGSDLKLGQLGEMKFGTLICYEAIFPEISRAFVDKGAEILVNITNDAWFGETAAPEQHLQMAAFRSVETRKTLLRAANSGYSAVISSKGRIYGKTDLFVQDTLVAEVEGNSTRTFFTLFGNSVNVGIIIITFATWFLLSRRRKIVSAR